MKHLIGFLLIVFSFTSTAVAHNADDLCLPGELDIGDGCITPYPHLGLDDPEYYSCWRHYQHSRRTLDKMQREAGSLRDQANQFAALNNLIAQQCAAAPKKCKGKYLTRPIYGFPLGEVCSHKGRPQVKCELVDLVSDYWHSIPMEVLSRKPGDLEFCQGQVAASEAGIAVQEMWNWIAQQWRDNEQAEFFRRSKLTFK